MDEMQLHDRLSKLEITQESILAGIRDIKEEIAPQVRDQGKDVILLKERVDVLNKFGWLVLSTSIVSLIGIVFSVIKWALGRGAH